MLSLFDEEVVVSLSASRLMAELSSAKAVSDWPNFEIREQRRESFFARLQHLCRFTLQLQQHTKYEISLNRRKAIEQPHKPCVPQFEFTLAPTTSSARSNHNKAFQLSTTTTSQWLEAQPNSDISAESPLTDRLFCEISSHPSSNMNPSQRHGPKPKKRNA